jgi:hypothetical protein
MSSRRCDPRCYDAKGNDCRCQCNGVNHGVGAQQARENYRKLGLAWKMPATRRITRRKNRKHPVSREQGCLFSTMSS